MRRARLLLLTALVFSAFAAAQVPHFSQTQALQASQANMQMLQSMMMRSAANAARAFRRNQRVLAARSQASQSPQAVPPLSKEAWETPEIQGDQLPMPMGDELVMSLGDEKSGDLRLVALDEASGKVRWEFATPQGLAVWPVPYEDSIALLTNEHEMVLLDAASGRARSRFPFGKDDLFVPAGGSHFEPLFPSVSGSTLIYAFKGQKKALNAQGVMTAVDLSLAKRLWVVALPEVPEIDPVVAGGVVVTGGGGQIRAFKLSDGTAAWVADLSLLNPVQSCLADGNRIFAAGDGKLVALDASTGKELWRQPYKGSQMLALESGHLLYLETRGIFAHAMWLVALDQATGLKAWEAKNSYGDLPWIQDGRAVVADDDGLKAFDVATGKQLWAQALPSVPLCALQGSEGRLYVVFQHRKEANIASIDLSTGKPVWIYERKDVGPTEWRRMLFVGEKALYYPGWGSKLVCLQ